MKAICSLNYQEGKYIKCIGSPNSLDKNLCCQPDKEINYFKATIFFPQAMKLELKQVKVISIRDGPSL